MDTSGALAPIAVTVSRLFTFLIEAVFVIIVPGVLVVGLLAFIVMAVLSAFAESGARKSPRRAEDRSPPASVGHVCLHIALIAVVFVGFWILIQLRILSGW
jgi:hypothetical protein